MSISIPFFLWCCVCMESSWLHGHVSPSILDSPLLPPPLSLPVLARANIGSLIVANTLWSAGFLYYTYLTFLGYTGTVKQDPSDKEIFGSAVYNTLASKYLYLVLFGWRANPTPFLFFGGPGGLHLTSLNFFIPRCVPFSEVSMYYLLSFPTPHPYFIQLSHLLTTRWDCCMWDWVFCLSTSSPSHWGTTTVFSSSPTTYGELEDFTDSHPLSLSLSTSSAQKQQFSQV